MSKDADAPAIRVSGLRKSYGAVEALRGIDIEVGPGEVFAFLGPNGAGKTTAVEIMEGFRSRDGGQVSVLGSDPASAGTAWRARIGVVLQTCRVPPALTVREALTLFAGYYPNPRPVDDTIEMVGLTGQRDRRGGRLSGGQQRRLDVALALIGDPELLFMDEPTTGFDPGARRQAWETIAGLSELGKTVFLTTHYLEEAQALADQVAILVRGEIVAQGPPAQLGASDRRAATISFRLPPGTTLADLPSAAGHPQADGTGGVRLQTEEPERALHVLTGWALERGTTLSELEVRRPGLEEIYLRLTGEDG